MKHSATMTIGIAGGSGSGKSTLARMLQAHLGEGFCGILAQDSYYRDLHEYFDHDGGSVNFDHPDALEFELLVQHLTELKAGNDIWVPRYDFCTHRRLMEKIFFPCRPVVVVDGTLVLAQSEVRMQFDLSIFVDTQEDLRFRRRLERDTRERGRTKEGVIEQFTKHVKPMHDLFVEPSRKFADRVVSGEKSFGPVIEEIVYGIKKQVIEPRESL